MFGIIVQAKRFHIGRGFAANDMHDTNIKIYTAVALKSITEIETS